MALLATAFVAGVLAACGGPTPSSDLGPAAAPGPRQGPGMRGGAPGPGMMGGQGDGGVVYSRLTCSAPSSLPGQTVRVVLADMGMNQMMGGVAPRGAHMMLSAMPGPLTPGVVSLVAQNMGWRTHELVVLPLASGVGAGQRVPGADGKIDESGSVGEASASCAAGTGDGIASGAVGWTTVNLSAGRYELVCNLPNHYADGMWQEFDVVGGQG